MLTFQKVMILESSCSCCLCEISSWGRPFFSSNMWQINVPVFSHLWLSRLLAALGPRWFVWAFSSCGEQGPLFGAVHELTAVESRCGAQAPGYLGFSSCSPLGSAALWHVGSSRTRDWTCVPYTGRRITILCTTREVLPPRSFCCYQLLASSPITYDLPLTLAFISAPANFNMYRGDPLKTPGSQPMTPHLQCVPVLSLLLKQSRTLWPLPCMSSACLCVWKL